MSEPARQAGVVALPRAPRRLRRGEKLYETIAREIVRRIREEKLPPDSQLPSEAQMLKEFGVGRASLREALRILEANGLITIKPGPGGGPVVAEVESRQFGRMATLYFQMGEMTFGELMEARLAVEPMMARFAAGRNDPALVAELQAAVAEAGSVPLSNDSLYLSTSADFHSVVARMSGNKILDLLGSSLLEIFYDRVGGMLFPVSRRRGVCASHAAIADAIAAGDGALAEELMREHMVEYVEYARRRHPDLLDEVVDWR
jgi:GntR family transcriptional regulator, transcriptional repressor for pyruvate dehydrogenase complex